MQVGKKIHYRSEQKYQFINNEESLMPLISGKNYKFNALKCLKIEFEETKMA